MTDTTILALQRPERRLTRDEMRHEKENYHRLVAVRSQSEVSDAIRDVAVANSNIGQLCMDMGEFPEAESALKSAFDLFSQLNDLEHSAIVAVQLAQLYVQLGKSAQARHFLQLSSENFAREFGPNSLPAKEAKRRLERFARTGRISRLREKLDSAAN